MSKISFNSVGKKFGRLTITEDLGTRGCPSSKRRWVRASCECGIVKDFDYQAVRTGGVRSCGCLNRENITKHGLVYHPLYSVWEGIVQRCYNKNHETYRHYGGKGVTMCDEWRNDFKCFYNWAIENGWENGLKVDKDKKCPKGVIPVYCPEYCSVITQSENMRHREGNRMIEYNGMTMCMKEWSEKCGVSYKALRARLNRGWSLERAFKNENFVHNQKKRAA